MLSLRLPPCLLKLDGFDESSFDSPRRLNRITMTDSRKQFFSCALLIIACCLPRVVFAQQPSSVFEAPVVVESSSISEPLPIVEPLPVAGPVLFQSSDASAEFQIMESPENITGMEYEIEYGNPIIECDPDAVPISENHFSEINEQQFTVKKSILGCMEDITILPQDEVWMINARDCICGETDLSRVKVNQLVDSEMVHRDLSQLTAAHSSGDDLVTVLYVHGNMTNEEYAIARGLQVYRNAFAQKAHCRGPVRYVIWAWKSEQEKTRFYPDYLVKSDRSVLVGETFAATLNQFSDRNMIAFGYSLGVQVILSAFDSPNLNPREGDPSHYQLAFAAPAINAEFVACNSLRCGRDTPVQKTFVFTNRKDRAIRAAQAIIRRKNPNEEATIAGLSDAGKLDVGPVTAVDVFGETGRFHSIERYTRSETLQTIMANLVNAVATHKSSVVADPITVSE